MKSSSSRLGGLTKELRAQWQDTKACWKDAKSQEFEQRYLEELFTSVDRTVTVIDQLDKLVSKVRKDCE
jgi:hypothetical protein